MIRKLNSFIHIEKPTHQEVNTEVKNHRAKKSILLKFILYKKEKNNHNNEFIIKKNS